MCMTWCNCRLSSSRSCLGSLAAHLWRKLWSSSSHCGDEPAALYGSRVLNSRRADRENVKTWARARGWLKHGDPRFGWLQPISFDCKTWIAHEIYRAIAPFYIDKFDKYVVDNCIILLLYAKWWHIMWYYNSYSIHGDRRSPMLSICV